MRPDELAQILADADGGISGTDTVRVSEDLIAQALAGPIPGSETNASAKSDALDSSMEDDTSPPEDIPSTPTTDPPLELEAYDEPSTVEAGRPELMSVQPPPDSMSSQGSGPKAAIALMAVAAIVTFLVVYL